MNNKNYVDNPAEYLEQEMSGVFDDAFEKVKIQASDFIDNSVNAGKEFIGIKPKQPVNPDVPVNTGTTETPPAETSSGTPKWVYWGLAGLGAVILYKMVKK